MFFTLSSESEENIRNGLDFKNDKSEDEPPSKKRKTSSGGIIKIMPNLIAISEISTPLITRSIQTKSGCKKPEVKPSEALKRDESVKLSLKESSSLSQLSTPVLDLSEKTPVPIWNLYSRNLSVSNSHKKRSPSPPVTVSTSKAPAVTITEKGSTQVSSPVTKIQKEPYQHENPVFSHFGNSPIQPYNSAKSYHPNTVENQMLQSMALVQRQHMHQLQAAMYASSVSKQPIPANSPLTNPAEFERVRNMLTWNALAQLQSHRSPTAVAQETSRMSSSSPSGHISNMTKSKAHSNISSNDSLSMNFRHFVQSQQTQAPSIQNPRMGLNSSVREIPNPSLLQQRRLTQLLHASVSQESVTSAAPETPSPKQFMETKLAANKELTVSIISIGDKSKKNFEGKRD